MWSAGLGDVAQRVFDGGPRPRRRASAAVPPSSAATRCSSTVLRRVGQPPVDVARIGEREPGRGLVRSRGTRSWSWRRSATARASVAGSGPVPWPAVQLQGFEVVLCGGHGRSWFVGVGCWVGGAMHGHRGVGGDCRPRGGGAGKASRLIDVGYGPFIIRRHWWSDAVPSSRRIRCDSGRHAVILSVRRPHFGQDGMSRGPQGPECRANG